PELASKLVVINPTTSGTGLEFLYWQYTYYEYVLHQNWTTWWKAILDKAYIASSWSSAFDVFYGDQNRPMMVSYATDPAYNYYFYNSTNLKAFVSEHDRSLYGWMYVEGAAIIKGTDNLEGAKLFIEFLLSEEFQREIPLNNWMYPAVSVELPEAYDYALDTSNVIPLNEMLSIEEIVSLKEYLTTEWLKIVKE
ncbi:MAG: thiamine ABC transporter substrate-binding protein, partial [Thermoplasmata archaeon]